VTTRPGIATQEEDQPRRRSRLAAGAVALGLPAIVYTAVLLAGYDGRGYLRGDSQYYYYTALSIWQDGDLDLANQLPPPLERHSTDVSLDLRGRLVPKHPIWLALAAQPLIIMLGPPGALAFNLIQIMLLLLFTYLMTNRYATPIASAAAVAATGTLSFIPHYVWNFSPDVFVCLLLMTGLLVLIKSSPTSHSCSAVGGVLFGCAALGKFSALLAAPGAPLLLGRPLRQRLILFAVGLALPLAVGAAINLHLFGSPLATSYDRIAVIHNDTVSLRSQRADFDLPPWQGAWGQLFDRRHGLLATSPITLLALLGLPALARRDRKTALYVGGTMLALFGFFSCYRLWAASHYGNRFLLPLVVLAALPLAAAFDELARIIHRLKSPG
jgi:hypothetical protein